MHWLQVKYDNDEVRENAPLRKAMDGDAGLDLYNASKERLIVSPQRSRMVPAGISIKLPDDCCALVYPRSSTFRKRGLFVVPGLIDSGYTGPIFTFVWHPNLNEVYRPIIIEPWERLSQLIVLPIPQLTIQGVDELPVTERGEKGFGSTGT
jgi:dUTP pyrophosphatase